MGYFFGMGLCYSMAGVGGNMDMVALFQGYLTTIFKEKGSRPFKDHHPFVLILVIPSRRGGALTLGENPFDTNCLSLKKIIKLLLFQTLWNIGKKI